MSVALLGPADAAREQLRQALLSLGADLMFEGEVRDGTRLSGESPQVLIVNLEPGVEDDLDALQGLLDNPGTSVVFNEGEVSSQLTGWDLARWARHLAAKVLGVRDTLPPPPSGSERLPELTLLPEPGRPVSPSQQQDHLRFDDFAEEALGHSDEVPASVRLELEPEQPAGSAASLGGLDFDFSPVQATGPADQAEPVPVAVESDDLESMDLSSLFEQDLGEVSPDDMLFKLQQAMGLDASARSEPAAEHSEPSGPNTRSHASSPPIVASAAAPVATPEAPTATLADPHEPLDIALDRGTSAPPPVEPEAESFSLDLDWEAPESPDAAGTSDAHAEAIAQQSDELTFDFAIALEDAPSTDDAARELAADTGATANASAEDGEIRSEAGPGWTADDSALSFDPVAFEVDDSTTATVFARSEALDVIELDAGESDPGLAEFDFSAFDTALETADDTSSATAQRYRIDAEEAALGGTLTLDAGADDEEIARLAAALDEQPSLPSTAELPPLEFDFAPPAEQPADIPASQPSAATPVAAAAPTGSGMSPAKGDKPGFGELSLQPLGDGFIDPGVKVPEAPVQTFDFSHLTLSLEPIEVDAPETSKDDPDAVKVATMRDGAWLRDIGEGPAPEPQTAAATEATSEIDADEEGPGDEGYAYAGSAVPPPLPAGISHSTTGVAPLTQGISRVVVLCASIGGPDALRSFLAGIPAGFPALFVVVQHLENGYFERLAQQMQKASPLPVRVPIAGISARDGEVLVVSSGARFLLAVDGQIELGEPAEASRYRPCIDDVLRDIADVFGPHAQAIIFSGMAADAVEGAVYLTRQGGEVWAQDPESCVVSSMVDGARSRGVVEFIGSPRELAEHCVRRFGAPA